MPVSGINSFSRQTHTNDGILDKIERKKTKLTADRRVISSRRPRCWVVLMDRDILSMSASSPRRITDITMATVTMAIIKTAGRALVYGSVS